jgi:hypothetical protein
MKTMPPSDRLDALVELEEKLSILRVHYGLCHDLQTNEVLEWAKFFLQWSRFVGEIGGSPAKTNSLKANKLFSELSNSKPSFKAYEALEKAMEQAQGMIQEEIFNAAKPRQLAAYS